MRRALLLGIPVLVATAIVMESAVLAGSRANSPRPAILSTGGSSIRVSVGTFCVDGPEGSGQAGFAMCADAAPSQEPPRPRLAVDPSDRIRVRFRDNPRINDDVARVSANLVRFEEQGEAYLKRKVRVRDLPGPRRWRLTLPRSLGPAEGIDIFARYKGGGDAGYLAGLKTPTDE